MLVPSQNQWLSFNLSAILFGNFNWSVRSVPSIQLCCCFKSVAFIPDRNEFSYDFLLQYFTCKKYIYHVDLDTAFSVASLHCSTLDVLVVECKVLLALLFCHLYIYYVLLRLLEMHNTFQLLFFFFFCFSATFFPEYWGSWGKKVLYGPSNSYYNSVIGYYKRKFIWSILFLFLDKCTQLFICTALK